MVFQEIQTEQMSVRFYMVLNMGKVLKLNSNILLGYLWPFMLVQWNNTNILTNYKKAIIEIK